MKKQYLLQGQLNWNRKTSILDTLAFLSPQLQQHNNHCYENSIRKQISQFQLTRRMQKKKKRKKKKRRCGQYPRACLTRPSPLLFLVIYRHECSWISPPLPPHKSKVVAVRRIQNLSVCLCSSVFFCQASFLEYYLMGFTLWSCFAAAYVILLSRCYALIQNCWELPAGTVVGNRISTVTDRAVSSVQSMASFS